MNRIRFLLLIIAGLTLTWACLCTERSQKQPTFYEELDTSYASLIREVGNLSRASTLADARRQFALCRQHYKGVEAFVEYYFQGLARRINGPNLPDVKTEDNIVNDPSGFQVLEEIVMAEQLDTAALRREAAILVTDLEFVKLNMKDMPTEPRHVHEAFQHQLIRIATWGITGFDSPVAKASLPEAAAALASLQHWFKVHTNQVNVRPDSTVLRLINVAGAALKKSDDFDTFDRLDFIKNHLMPLSEAVKKAYQPILSSNSQQNIPQFFSGTLADLMQGRGFNPDALSPFAEARSTPAKVALGKALFNDPLLSKKQNMSCGTCHQAERAFTDGRRVSLQPIHAIAVNRNSPTIMYAGLQRAYFYDLRSQDLENQIGEVIHNPNEFGLSEDVILSRIDKQPRYDALITTAFPMVKKMGAFELKNALAAYVRSLNPFNSKLDNFFRGKAELSQQERLGFNLFTGKAACATCHFMPLTNGTVPPWFTVSESEVIGVPQQAVWQNAQIDPDEGRYRTSQLAPLRFGFKTPTLRNISLTAPYMHNGVYKTLDEVIRFYDIGGGQGIGIQVLNHQTLPFSKLNLTAAEKEALLKFLFTLTDQQTPQ